MIGIVLFLATAALAEPGEHAHHMRDLAPGFSVAPRPDELPEPTPGPDTMVYGYQAYWAADLTALPWDELSHLALFAAEVGDDGTLTDTRHWDDAATAVELAAAYDVRVHLTVINFDTASLRALLGSETARNRLIDSLDQWVEDTGAHGVNIDFESLPSSRRGEMVTFVRDLAARVPEVVLATPSVDWSDAWDYAALTDHADLFIMGYGYHYSGSDNAGPVDPLYGGGPWAPWSLEWSVDDYLGKGADPERVILGLPLYGYRWRAGSSVPAEAEATGTAVLWREANDEASVHGRQFDEHSRTPWTHDGEAQIWYGDTESLRERIAWAVDEELGGVGFWALNYDRGEDALWQMVRDETTFPRPDEGDPDAFTARAGRPFLAYPGDTIVLNGENSTGPDGVDLRYRWTQVAGPPVQLDATASQPSFEVKEPLPHVFELVVGDGEVWSAAARSHVVVLDPAAGRRHSGGCSIAPMAAGWLPMLAMLWVRRRR